MLTPISTPVTALLNLFGFFFTNSIQVGKGFYHPTQANEERPERRRDLGNRSKALVHTGGLQAA
jgi:hypothetical protein